MRQAAAHQTDACGEKGELEFDIMLDQ